MLQNLTRNVFVPYLILVTSFLLFISLIYTKIRRKFPYKVNCWFCNTDTKVSYDKRNSFNCPSCTQYNGFNDDGDYNREIPEQKYSKFNLNRKQTFCKRTLNSRPAFNGFCEICNRNQELKIQQLATFVPQCENQYEEEIAEYKKKLEESYQLCSQCQRHLKRVLTRVKTNVLGSKLAQISIKGLKAVDTHIKQKITVSSQFKSIKALLVISIVLMSVINFLYESREILQSDWQDLVNDNIYKTIVKIYSHIAAAKDTVVHLISQSDIYKKTAADMARLLDNSEWKEINAEDTMNLLPWTALFSNVLLISLNMNHIKHHIITMFLLWSLKMCLNDFDIASPYLEWIKISNAIVILMISLRMWNSQETVPTKTNAHNNSFHKLYSDCGEDSDTEIDCSDASVISQQTIKSARSKKQTNPVSPMATTLPVTVSNFQPSGLSLNTSKTLMDVYLDRLETSVQNQEELNRSFSTYKPNESISRYSETFESLSARNDIKNSSSFDLNDTLSSRNLTFHSIKESDNLQMQNDITKLKIGNSNASVRDLSLSKNPFSLDRSRANTPTPSLISFTSSAARFNIVQPPRLNIVDPDPAASSWVGGGYWGSPQKRNVEKSLLNASLSRASSQSSGFESIKEKNSRENSLCLDVDKFSAFSEPVKPTRNLFAESVYSGNSAGFLRKSVLSQQGAAATQTTMLRNNSSFFSQNLNSSLPTTNPTRHFGSYRDSYFKY